MTITKEGKSDALGQMPDQRSRFIEAARELGADDDEATFKAKLGAIARQKAKDAPEPPEAEVE